MTAGESEMGDSVEKMVKGSSKNDEWVRVRWEIKKNSLRNQRVLNWVMNKLFVQYSIYFELNFVIYERVF